MQAKGRVLQDGRFWLGLRLAGGEVRRRRRRRASRAELSEVLNPAYSSWERGTVENTNGLLLQYYPKQTDFNDVTDEEIQKLENAINMRPKKIFSGLSPVEVHTCVHP